MREKKAACFTFYIAEQQKAGDSQELAAMHSTNIWGIGITYDF